MHGDDIKALREMLGLTQVSFARLLGVDWRSVDRWEDDASPPKHTHAALMEVLGRVWRDNLDSPALRYLKDLIDASIAIGGLGGMLLILLDSYLKAKMAVETRLKP